MPHPQRRLSRICLGCVLVVGFAGCVSKRADDNPDASAPGSDGDFPPDPSVDPVTGKPGNTAGSRAAGAGGASGRSGASGDGSGDPGAVDLDSAGPEFEGIPTTGFPLGVAPDNCTIGATNTADTLVLPLDATIRGMVLSAQNGKILVNGVTCTAFGTPTNIKITGTMSIETVIVDFSQGDFPDSLRTGTISIDVGAGKDIVAIAGTRDTDDIQMGSMANVVRVRIGTQKPLITIANQETLIVSAGPGDDRIQADGGGDLGDILAAPMTAYGGAGSDFLSGGMGADALHGGIGDDVFSTSAAADGGDIYDGGSGIDSLTYEKRAADLIITLDNKANDGEPNELDNVQDTIEVLTGGSGNDTITGSDADNTFNGGPGNDVMNGGDGNDVFVSGPAADGADVMHGGAGTDTVDYSARTHDLVVMLCLPSPSSCGTGACGCQPENGEAGESDSVAAVENVVGGSGNDRIVGSLSDNTLSGGPGSDELHGGAGNDTLYGGLGDDQLFGDADDDLLSGDDGIDSLDGGDGQGDICIWAPPEMPVECELF
jgi:Ca2+-binding RTX toxin-like protein